MKPALLNTIVLLLFSFLMYSSCDDTLEPDEILTSNVWSCSEVILGNDQHISLPVRYRRIQECKYWGGAWSGIDAFYYDIREELILNKDYTGEVLVSYTYKGRKSSWDSYDKECVYESYGAEDSHNDSDVIDRWWIDGDYLFMEHGGPSVHLETSHQIEFESNTAFIINPASVLCPFPNQCEGHQSERYFINGQEINALIFCDRDNAKMKFVAK